MSCPWRAVPWSADPAEVWQRYREGCSVRLLHPQQWNNNLWWLLSTLERHWQQLAGAPLRPLFLACTVHSVPLHRHSMLSGLTWCWLTRGPRKWHALHGASKAYE